MGRYLSLLYGVSVHLAFWAMPEMTAGHLFFAAATTGYILVAIQLEEGDRLRYHGEDYARYRERAPMLIPGPWPGGEWPRPDPSVSPPGRGCSPPQREPRPRLRSCMLSGPTEVDFPSPSAVRPAGPPGGISG